MIATTGDGHDRKCVDCHGDFTPYSMDKDSLPVVPPSVFYKCITCRSKVKVPDAL